YPVKISINKISNINISKQIFDKSDATTFTDKNIKYSIPFKLLKKNGELSGNIKFSICSKSQCFMKKIPFKVLI
ncbi:MAG: hypothetical protein JXR91_13905, partial [Deltaproteobacteria bacterium]|nr:hypothetical protein [Deltaproteobacteria bacterium]